MMDQDLNNYMEAVKTRQKPEIKLAQSKKNKIWNEQKGKCSECKKGLREYLYKITDSKIICSECAIKIPKKRN